ncbi:hypothetical protein GCM10009651_03420 [Microbacterium natoriense]
MAMNRSQKIAVAVSALTVAGLAAIAAPAIAAATSTVGGWSLFGQAAAAPDDTAAPRPVETPADTPSPAPVDPFDGCERPAQINWGRMTAQIAGIVEDRGPHPYAEGTVGADESGAITTYTVAPGDGLIMIGERLCIEAGALDMFNHSRDIYPGQVLRLTQDPNVPNVPFLQPPDAPEGFQQIPYQQAIVDMRKAANAGDVDTMRRIWTKTLAPMFPVQADADLISAFLDAGDITELRQMFA